MLNEDWRPSKRFCTSLGLFKGSNRQQSSLVGSEQEEGTLLWLVSFERPAKKKEKRLGWI